MAKLIEGIAAGGLGILEQELYALVYARDRYKEKVGEIVVNEHLI